MDDALNTPAVDAFIGIGSNIAPRENVTGALLALKACMPVIAISSFYRSPAVGPQSQPDFLNGVIRVKAACSPRDLKFGVLRECERLLGRVRSADKYAPRTIDLDLLLYGSMVLNEPDLLLPDPNIRIYPFVAVPLLELAPDLVLPGADTPLADEPAAMVRTHLRLEPEFTDELRRLILG
jgi:2-amino-4-hydroxy-6-hydroxymethyldihydropteridine diphosphokinase